MAPTAPATAYTHQHLHNTPVPTEGWEPSYYLDWEYQTHPDISDVYFSWSIYHNHWYGYGIHALLRIVDDTFLVVTQATLDEEKRQRVAVKASKGKGGKSGKGGGGKSGKSGKGKGGGGKGKSSGGKSM
jgi:uncharacterized membrane protein YgcG